LFDRLRASFAEAAWRDGMNGLSRSRTKNTKRGFSCLRDEWISHAPLRTFCLLLAVVQNDLQARAAVCVQHANRRLQLPDRHHVADQRLQPDLSRLHQGDGARIVLAFRHAVADESELLEIEVVKREGPFFRGDDSEE